MAATRKSPLTQLHLGTALADARATDLGRSLFSSPTVREGRDFDGAVVERMRRLDFFFK